MSEKTTKNIFIRWKRPYEHAGRFKLVASLELDTSPEKFLKYTWKNHRDKVLKFDNDIWAYLTGNSVLFDGEAVRVKLSAPRSCKVLIWQHKSITYYREASRNLWRFTKEAAQRQFFLEVEDCVDGWWSDLRSDALEERRWRLRQGAVVVPERDEKSLRLSKDWTVGWVKTRTVLDAMTSALLEGRLTVDDVSVDEIDKLRRLFTGTLSKLQRSTPTPRPKD
jgi:hypothetical protein